MNLRLRTLTDEERHTLIRVTAREWRDGKMVDCPDRFEWVDTLQSWMDENTADAEAFVDVARDPHPDAYRFIGGGTFPAYRIERVR